MNDSSGSDQHRGQSLAQSHRLNRWRAASLLLFSSCFPICLFGAATPTIAYVQGNSATPQTPQTSVKVKFSAAQVAGDLNVIVVGWNDSEAVVSTVTDSKGNAYTLAAGPTIQNGYASQSIYLAKNIASAAAGTNTVTVTFASAATSPDIRVIEYSGADSSNPLDVTAANSGNSATSSSGTAITTNATDLVFGANLVQTLTTGPGSAFTKRLLTTPDGDIAEDKMVTAGGSYSAAAPLSSSGPWIMQLIALRTPSGTTPPSLTALSCNSTSITGSGTDSCTVTLDVAAPSGGFIVSLSSNNAAVTVPSTVTVAANATSAAFTANVTSVATAQAVLLTASASSVSQTFTLQLNAAIPALSVATSGSPSTYGGAVTLTVTISSGPTGSVTFYNGGASIGTAAINGTTATFTTSSLTAGSHTITAGWAGNSYYAPATSGAITQLVNQAKPSISWTAPAAITYGTPLSGTQLNASSTVAGSFNYSPAVGTVLTAGTHTITATFTPTDSTDYATATSSVSITVNAPAPPITWAAPTAITYGTVLSVIQLDASSTVAGTFAYSPTAGTVLTAGMHTITTTFTPTDSTDYSTATSTVSITVNAATPTIAWVAPAAIAYGTALSGTQLDATSTVAGTFVYSPAAGTVLTTGTHTITGTFTPTDSTDYSTATSSVSITVNTVTPAITWAAPAAIVYGTALSGTQLDASSTVAGSFGYSPATGTVLTTGTHTITATFTPTDSTDYVTATSSVSITVNTATPTITWATPAAISYGTALSSTQLDASSTVAGSFSYSPATGTVLTTGTHTITGTFTPADSTDFVTATSSVSITVNTATPTTTWVAPAAISYGTALSGTQLDASSTVAGSFSYSPAAGTVLTTGTHTITVTFTPTDSTDYVTETSSVSITVNKATPTITWPTPAAISYGTALSSTQLDASSTVAGSFVYSPAAGIVLAAGSQTLSVTFAPADTTDYASATHTVTLTVNSISAFVQGAASTISSSAASLSLSFPANTLAGDLIVVGFDFSANATLSVTDSQGNTFTPVGTQLTSPGGIHSVVYYGKNIKGGADTVTVTLSAKSSFIEIYLTEYSGIDQSNPIDVQAGASGSAGTVSSGNATTTFAGDVTYGYCVGDSSCTAGSGFAARSTFDENLVEDQTVGNPGSYAATGSASSGWTMHMLALKPASSGSAGAVPTITSAATASGKVGSAFSYQIIASNTPTSYGAAGLPTGLSLNTASGLISGTPLAAGTSTVMLSAINGAGTGNATLTLTIVGVPTITSATTASGKTGSAFSYQITASNTPTSYGVAGLPTGISVNSVSGLISGTPTTAGTSAVTLSATNSAGTGNATLTLTIAAAPAITSATTANGTVGSAFSYQITATNAPAGFAASGLPAGLTVNSGTGLISGTPTAAGTSTVALSATNSAGTGSATLTITVAASGPALGINATSVPFGSVVLNTPATQTVTLTSTGTTAVTVNSATATGIGFTLSSGPTFPATLTPGQTAILGVEFDPTITGSATGQLTINSTTSTNGTAIIPLSGTGTAASYAVTLSWDAPTSSPDPVAGYNVYRSPSGGSMYQLMNSVADTQTTYSDSTVQNGQSYDYIVESVDDTGIESVPTSPITVVIP